MRLTGPRLWFGVGCFLIPCVSVAQSGGTGQPLFPSDRAEPTLAEPGATVPQMDFRQFVVRRFLAADTDKDGLLTEAEVAALEVQRFNRLDRNQDGQIDVAEFAGPTPPGLTGQALDAWRARRGGQFGLLDSNRDGRIGVQEFTDNVRRSAARVDANGDGRITLEEFGESMRQVAVAQTGNRTDNAVQRAFDRNGDGLVARSEMEQGLEARFRAADTNGDGRITLSELFPRGTSSPQETARFTEQDANRDNSLSLAEFASRWQQLFVALDRNGDHQLSGDELAAGRF